MKPRETRRAYDSPAQHKMPVPVWVGMPGWELHASFHPHSLESQEEKQHRQGGAESSSPCFEGRGCSREHLAQGRCWGGERSQDRPLLNRELSIRAGMVLVRLDRDNSETSQLHLVEKKAEMERVGKKKKRAKGRAGTRLFIT